MTSSLRERQRQLREDTILDTARVILAQKGYAAMSMDDLAAEVGISKPTLYSHFATKDKLIAAALAREMNHLLTILESHKEQLTPLQRLVLLHQSIIQFHFDEGMTTLRPMMPDLKHIVCEHSEVLERMQQLHNVVLALIKDGIREREIDPALDPSCVARIFFVLLGALRPPPFDLHETIDITNIAQTITTIFSRGVRPQS